MSNPLATELHSLLHYERIIGIEHLQSLWSGYGTIDRVYLSGYEQPSVIVKNISAPKSGSHPRGWNTNVGHLRKLRSYEVETYWYQHYNHQCNSSCRTARFLGYKKLDTHTLLVLEDLHGAGYNQLKHTLTHAELLACLSWLAAFHARFMGSPPDGLWEIGTYWQLETRQEEWKAMAHGPLKENANAIHAKLNNARFQTLVHGDAKYANFCFSPTGKVAAVDFQYVGRGCGMKDVVYLLSCIEGGIRDQQVEELLSHYFSALSDELTQNESTHNHTDLECEWRDLFAFAWADFERFLQGWSPGHWKSNDYIQKQVDIAVRKVRRR